MIEGGEQTSDHDVDVVADRLCTCHIFLSCKYGVRGRSHLGVGSSIAFAAVVEGKS